MTRIQSGPFAIGDDLAASLPRRPRSACIPSPLHAPADNLDRPTVFRRAEQLAMAALNKRDPRLDDLATYVAEQIEAAQLGGDDATARRHRARNVVTVVALESAATTEPEIVDASALGRITKAFESAGLKPRIAEWAARLALEAHGASAADAEHALATASDNTTALRALRTAGFSDSDAAVGAVAVINALTRAGRLA